MGEQAGGAPVHATAMPATDWREHVRDDEDTRFAAYARDIEGFQREQAERTDGTVRRAFHTKPHAGLLGMFTVLADIPDHAKHGTFRAPMPRRELIERLGRAGRRGHVLEHEVAETV